jgi:hypothetical protein
VYKEEQEFMERRMMENFLMQQAMQNQTSVNAPAVSMGIAAGGMRRPTEKLLALSLPSGSDLDKIEVVRESGTVKYFPSKVYKFEKYFYICGTKQSTRTIYKT